MANEIVVCATSGQTLYAILRNAAGQPYNTATPGFEAYSGAHYASYALALAEQGATGYYLGAVPSAFGPPGRYLVEALVRSGATVVPGDAALGAAVLLWDGTAEVTGPLTNAAGQVTVGSYASGLDPATQVLQATQNKLRTNASGQVQVDLAQAVPTSNTAQTVGDALNAARAQGFGKWVLAGTTLTLYAPDGTTQVRSFSLDNAAQPTQRT